MFPIFAFVCGVLVGAGLMGLMTNAWLLHQARRYDRDSAE